VDVMDVKFFRDANDSKTFAATASFKDVFIIRFWMISFEESKHLPRADARWKTREFEIQ